MRIAPGVEMLELSAMLLNGPGILCPTVLWDQEIVILVDAGLPGMARQFIDAIKQAGIPPEKLTKVIITHHDLDHIGSLRELQELLVHKIEIVSHSEEVRYIQGELPPIKLTPKMMEQMREQMKDMPEETRQGMREMMERMKGAKIKVDSIVHDGEVLSYCGGIQIVHTPGHTPGHICLYHLPSKTLIGGDSLFVDGGNLVRAPEFVNAENAIALASLQKLTRYDISSVIAYHGGLYRDAPNARIAELTLRG